MTIVMTGSDLKKLTEGELGIGWGGGANSEYLSVILLRGIQRKKAEGREGEGGGVKEPITFLTKSPKGVPMFCVIDSNVVLINAMSSECYSMRKSRRGGGCSEPPLRFPVWIFDGRRGQGGHGLWKTGKMKKKYPCREIRALDESKKTRGEIWNFAIAIQLRCSIKLTRSTGGFFFFEILNLMRISIYQNSKLFINILYLWKRYLW